MNDETLIHGDCLIEMQNIPDCSIDLTVTSPPYDNLRTYNNSLEWGEHIWKPCIEQLFRITKPGGVVVWVVCDSTINGSESGTSFRQALFFMSCGFNLHDTMIYSKNQYMPLTHNRYEQSFEYMFIFSKGKPKTFNPICIESLTFGTARNRGKSKSNEITYSERCREEVTNVKPTKQKNNIWSYDVGGSNKDDKTAHNAPFPEALANDHIISWSNEGDIIFDPFTGSGTTGKMAILNNRKFIGIEKEQKYFDIATERIKKAQSEYNQRQMGLDI